MPDIYAPPIFTPEEIAQVHEMQREGFAINDIAEMMGVLSRDVDLNLWNALGEPDA